jgi:hypothetical protein
VDHIKLYREVNDLENTLSRWAARPVIGTVPALTKSIVGIAQVIFGSMLCMKGACDRVMGRDSNDFTHGVTHIKHGIGNITGGLITAIPLVGTIVHFVKQTTNLYSVYNRFVTGHENKFMPYEALVKQDIKIGFLGFANKLQEDYAENHGYPLIEVSKLYNYHETHGSDAKELQEINAKLNESLIEKGRRDHLTLREIKAVGKALLKEYKKQRQEHLKMTPKIQVNWDFSFGMGNTKSIYLENLPSALIQMHKDLCVDMNNSVEKAEKSQEYTINGLDVNVTVNMVRIVRTVPEGAQYCGGKLSKDTVKVTVSPSNEEVEQGVASHFKNQIYHDFFTQLKFPMFNEIVINDKKVI